MRETVLQMVSTVITPAIVPCLVKEARIFLVVLAIVVYQNSKKVLSIMTTVKPNIATFASNSTGAEENALTHSRE